MRQNENDSSNTGFSSTESENALKSLRTLSIDPSPFLKTRVLAHAREQKQVKTGFLKKYFLQAGLATCFLFVIAFSFYKNTDSVPSYAVGQDYVIRMDIRPYKDAGISYAEVVLGDEKVQFSSSRFSEISAQKKIVVSWENLVEKQFLPIIIKGMQSGSSKVVVNFYDADNNLVKSQDVNLKFKPGHGG